MAFRLDRSRFNAERGKLRAALDRKLATMREVVEEHAREVAHAASVELALATFPTASLLRIAENSIRGQIGRVFLTASGAYEILRAERGEAIAKAFYGAFKRRDFTAARQILGRSGTSIADIEIGPLDPALYQAASQGGKVTLTRPRRIVPREQLDAFVRRVCAEKLGNAASGWSACAARLGSESGIPRYKSTGVHGANNGDVEIRREGGKITVTLINRVPEIRRLLSSVDRRRIEAQARDDLLDRLARS
jgi:hypothetical protein